MGGIVIQTSSGHGTQSSYTSELFFTHLHRQEVLANDNEVKALKSFIRADSLTSPQHPFYDPKAEGVEMYMGKYHKLEHATTLTWAQELCPTENHVFCSPQSRRNTCDIGSKLWGWSIGSSRCLVPTTF